MFIRDLYLSLSLQLRHSINKLGEMFTQNLSLITSFAHQAQVHYKVYSLFLTNEPPNICALHNFGQDVRKEGYDLITCKSTMTKQDKQSPYAFEDDD